MDEKQIQQLDAVNSILNEFQDNVHWLRRRGETVDERRRDLLRDFLQRAIDAFDAFDELEAE